MHCYDCLPEEVQAVAVCCLCGKGVCGKHCLRQERVVLQPVSSGMAAQVRRAARNLPRMVCTECAAAVGTADAAGEVVIR